MTGWLVATGDGIHGGDDVELAGHAVTALAIDGDTWWAIVDGHVWRRTAGLVWERVDTVHPIHATALLPTSEGLLVGTAEAHVALLHGDLRLLPGFEQVSGRERWHTPWGAPADVRTMAADEGGWYVNVHVGGVVRSADRGVTWQPTIDIETDVHQVVAGADGLYAATGAAGLAVSRDRGVSWTLHAEGLHASYCRAVAITGESVLVSASTGPGRGKAAVYRRALDSGGTFERCTDWFRSNIDSGCLTAQGESAAFATAEGEVYVSTDAGLTWSAAIGGLPPVRQVVVG